MMTNEKNPLRAITTAQNLDEPLALIDCGEFNLLISSKDIVTLMPAQKLLPMQSAQACGALEFEQSILPVFAFTKALQPAEKLSPAQLTLVVLQHQTQIFAVACCAIEKLEASELQLFSVPLSMSSRKQPFTQFAVVNNRAAGLSSAADLLSLLRLRGVEFSAVNTFANKPIQEAS